MLQKSRSTGISKFKFLIIVPLMLAMLTYVSCAQENSVSVSENDLDATADSGVLSIKVTDLKNQTSEEKSKVETAVATLKAGDVYEKVLIADGVKTIEFTIDPDTGKERIMVKNNSGEKSSVKGTSKDLVAFSEIDEVPVYPGCEGLTTNEDRKACFSENIAAHVSSNFNIKIGKELGLTSINRVFVQFKINIDGSIEVVKANAPHEALEAEAVRVVNELPQMKPGKNNGEEVAVLYTLPISFVVN